MTLRSFQVRDALEFFSGTGRRHLVLQFDLNGVRKTSRTTSASPRAKQAVIDEDAVSLVADGLVQERGGHAGIDSTGKTQDDPFLPDLGADHLDAWSM